MMSDLTVVVAVRPDDVSQKMLGVCLTVIGDRTADVVLVSCVAPPTPDDSEGRDYGARAEEAARRLETAVVGLATPSVAFRASIPKGTHLVPDAVLRVASQEEADFIVLGVRSRSRVGKLIMGSKAQSIILAAECPVVAVRMV